MQTKIDAELAGFNEQEIKVATSLLDVEAAIGSVEARVSAINFVVKTARFVNIRQTDDRLRRKQIDEMKRALQAAEEGLRIARQIAFALRPAVPVPTKEQNEN